MKKAATALAFLSGVIGLTGLVLYVGNISGWVPSVPFAGSGLMTTAKVLAGVAYALRHGNDGLALEKRRTSLVIVIPFMLLFSILSLGGFLMLRDNLMFGASALRWTLTTLFAVGVTSALLLLVTDLTSRMIGTWRPAQTPDAAGPSVMVR